MAEKRTSDTIGDDDLREATEAFELCVDCEAENRKEAEDDIRFARLGEQWPEKIRKQREDDGRPVLTINRMQAFIRQVTNDARQNKPSIKVRPVDSAADIKTAAVIDGLVRNIENQSSADVAYDTAGECAVTNGFGYIGVSIEWAFDDSFDKDIRINRIADPMTVYRDPYSTAADSSDWNIAFQVEAMPKKAFEARWKGADAIDWSAGDYADLKQPWRDGDNVLVCAWWKRVEAPRTILLLSDGRVVGADVWEAPIDGLTPRDAAAAAGVTVVQERVTRSYQVTQHIMTGAEILEVNDWAGRYIPIVPVYGDEVVVDGKRIFRSLIRDAKDPQRMFNFWRTNATELVALAPRAPFIGPEQAFTGDDAHKWASINRENYAFVSYRGQVAPQRQPLDLGTAAGSLQEALNAADDMKAAMGLYDASLGARSNETSGRAIIARQREGDTSTFHFIDNVRRAITHVGRIVLDLIPHVYSGRRMIRILGEDGTPAAVQLAPRGEAPAPVPPTPTAGAMTPQLMPGAAGQAPQPPQMPAGGAEVYDLSVGKYDLVVETGPSFNTKREEAVNAIVEIIRANPPSAPILAPMLFKNMDWPGADEIAQKLEGAQAQQQAQAGPGGKGGAGGKDPALEAAKLQQDGQEAAAKLSLDERRLKLEERKQALAEAKAAHDAKMAEAKLAEEQAARQQQRADALLPDREAMVGQHEALAAQSAEAVQATHQAVVDMAAAVQAMAGQVQALTGAVGALADKVNAPRAIVSRGGLRRLRVGNVEHDIVRAADGTVTLGEGQAVN